MNLIFNLILIDSEDGQVYGKVMRWYITYVYLYKTIYLPYRYSIYILYFGFDRTNLEFSFYYKITFTPRIKKNENWRRMCVTDSIWTLFHIYFHLPFTNNSICSRNYLKKIIKIISNIYI